MFCWRRDKHHLKHLLMLLFIFPVRVVLSSLLCVCVCVWKCGRNQICVNADHMPKSRSEGDREGKGLRFYLFMCVFLYLKSWTMLMLEEICNLRKYGVKKPPWAMYNPQGCQAASRQGQTRGGRRVQGSWLVTLYYFEYLRKMWLSYKLSCEHIISLLVHLTAPTVEQKC